MGRQAWPQPPALPPPLVPPWARRHYPTRRPPGPRLPTGPALRSPWLARRRPEALRATAQPEPAPAAAPLLMRELAPVAVAAVAAVVAVAETARVAARVAVAGVAAARSSPTAPQSTPRWRDKVSGNTAQYELHMAARRKTNGLSLTRDSSPSQA